MCGLAGWVGVPMQYQQALARGLARGIDTRGGHACGFLTVDDVQRGDPRIARRAGPFAAAPARWLAKARGEVVLLHARYATCGDPTRAHPLEVRRSGRVVLAGAHNGVLRGAWLSAATHGRRITIDSQEALELLADGEDPAQLEGWGVVVWWDYAARRLRWRQLHRPGPIVFRRFEGGIVFASTDEILQNALESARR